MARRLRTGRDTRQGNVRTKDRTGVLDRTGSRAEPEHGLLVDGSLIVFVFRCCDVPRDCCSTSLQSRTVLSSSIWLTKVQEVLGPQHFSAMFNQVGITKRVFVGDGGQLPARDKLERGARLPQPYCLVVPEEPLRYLLQPRICNVIIMPAEIRCSHAWPAGVNRSLLVENIMPKLYVMNDVT